MALSQYQEPDEAVASLQAATASSGVMLDRSIDQALGMSSTISRSASPSSISCSSDLPFLVDCETR